MKNINNFSIHKKKVLFRADLNVPIVNSEISDFSRIETIKISINKLIKQQNKIFIVAHLGRPKGKVNKKYSLKFLCPILEKEFGLKKIYFLENLNSENILKKIEEMNFGEICLIENIRFSPGEEKNDESFAKNLSSFFDIYVNDAFSSSHREHSSIVGLTKFLPSVAGDSLITEMKNINSFLEDSKKPNLAIIGGSKISTKIHLLNNLTELFDTIIVGGAMANTFLYANKINVGISLVEKDYSENAKSIQIKAKNSNCKLILPIDVVCSNNHQDIKNIRYCEIANVLPDQMILDVGEKTINVIKNEILKSQMLLWNGPLGAFEYKPFDQSTFEVAHIIKKYSNDLQIKALAGGGETISAIKSAKAENGFTYISNAGGAFLEWLEGKESPGIKALKENINF
tara:strand:- start:519 stop:1718 length:1200 start_codon:yes stop_codon:yes gene_type:complete